MFPYLFQGTKMFYGRARVEQRPLSRIRCLKQILAEPCNATPKADSTLIGYCKSHDCF